MTELRLRAGAWSAVLLPTQGAAFAELGHAGVAVLAPLPPGADSNTAVTGAFWMIPWANRMADGVLGTGWNLPVNRARDKTAIHGLSRDRPWQVLRATADQARLVQTVSAPPYAYRAMVSVRLDEDGVRIAALVTNHGVEPAPIGLGWHPWFARRPGQRVSFAARHRLATDERLLPVAVAASPGLEDAEIDSIEGTDAHFAGWNGRARLEDSILRLTMRAGGTWARNLQLYVPPHARTICLEPASHIPNAPNCPALAPLGPLRPLAPGASRSAWLHLAALH
ncbi:aldose epimerase family protein [Plastoroseomonas arctica]|uniref:Aldose epimerase n=1 Tax=Plastoroseomonas arctica TaxID=1509237 RepID=A0AAF1JV33_9PROT|nr:aldose epimerase [Plastoroseomonas arctica]MBR0654337.1 aldose epimerase [Plastoroseomonas arctica]